MSEDKGSPALSVDVAANIVQSTRLHSNLDQDVHMISRERIENALLRMLPKYAPSERILAVLGLVLAFVAALVSADFTAAFGVPAVAWKTLFVVGLVASGGWLVVLGVKWLRRASVDDIVTEIVKGARPVDK